MRNYQASFAIEDHSCSVTIFLLRMYLFVL